MFLLDTDTVIYSLKGNESVRRNLRQHLDDPLKICTITLMELYFGAYKSKKVAGNAARVKAIETSFEIIPPGIETVEVFGMLKASLEKTGTPLDDFDLIIASCAIAHNLTLVTNNTRHFSRIDELRLTNWVETDED